MTCPHYPRTLALAAVQRLRGKARHMVHILRHVEVAGGTWWLVPLFHELGDAPGGGANGWNERHWAVGAPVKVTPAHRRAPCRRSPSTGLPRSAQTSCRLCAPHLPRLRGARLVRGQHHQQIWPAAKGVPRQFGRRRRRHARPASSSTHSPWVKLCGTSKAAERQLLATRGIDGQLLGCDRPCGCCRHQPAHQRRTSAAGRAADACGGGHAQDEQQQRGQQRYGKQAAC